MRKTLVLSLFLLLVNAAALVAQDVVGFWKTIDDKTGRPESIIAIYDYNGKVFGRIVATYNEQGKIDDTIYNPKDRAPGVIGNPFYAGLDIIWNLQKNGSKYSKGHIMDPEKGRVYDAEMWREGRHLIVRGEIFFFGRNQAWDPALESDFPHGFKKPDLNTLVPSIPRVK